MIRIAVAKFVVAVVVILVMSERRSRSYFLLLGTGPMIARSSAGRSTRTFAIR